jgi:tartrate/fumarate subfamily iron-sulfur-dependent hydro-lyase beta chain
MEYHLDLPIKETERLRVGDIIYISGKMFTARDEAHRLMLEKDSLPFSPSEMALFHCGPLMKRNDKWEVVSAGPTTSSRMEIFEDKFIKKFGVTILIGKGGMGEKTREALKRYGCIYAAYTGGAGALAAEKIKRVIDVFWLEELGMPEAVWVFEVKDFGPLIVAMDSKGESIYKS